MLKTFSIGGVHPHENKLSAHQPIITAEVPAKAVILLGQHIGAPAKPVVAKGDVVKVGTKLLNLPALFRQQFTLRSVVKWRRLILLSMPAVMRNLLSLSMWKATNGKKQSTVAPHW